jgi:hypothetical protein
MARLPGFADIHPAAAIFVYAARETCGELALADSASRMDAVAMSPSGRPWRGLRHDGVKAAIVKERKPAQPFCAGPRAGAIGLGGGRRFGPSVPARADGTLTSRVKTGSGQMSPRSC